MSSRFIAGVVVNLNFMNSLPLITTLDDGPFLVKVKALYLVVSAGVTPI